MQDLLKYCRMPFGSDTISNCANELKELQKLKLTYPPKEESLAISINLKA